MSKIISIAIVVVVISVCYYFFLFLPNLNLKEQEFQRKNDCLKLAEYHSNVDEVFYSNKLNACIVVAHGRYFNDDWYYSAEDLSSKKFLFNKHSSPNDSDMLKQLNDFAESIR